MGYDLNELFYQTFKEFLDNNIELKFADEEFQNKQYSHHEERRIMKLQKAMEVIMNNINFIILIEKKIFNLWQRS